MQCGQKTYLRHCFGGVLQHKKRLGRANLELWRGNCEQTGVRLLGKGLSDGRSVCFRVCAQRLRALRPAVRGAVWGWRRDRVMVHRSRRCTELAASDRETTRLVGRDSHRPYNVGSESGG